MWIVPWNPKIHEYAYFAEFGGPINSAMGSKKQSNVAETSIKSVHCNYGVNADTDVGQINAIQTLT